MTTQTTPPLDALSQVLDAGGLLPNVFAQIEIADRIVREFVAQRPESAATLNAAFRLCASPLVCPGLPPAIFEAHCRQLLRLLLSGEDLDRPTLIEAAVMICKVSEKAPPITDAVLLITGDAETMQAFGLEPVGAPDYIGNHLWPQLRATCRRVYKAAYGKTRSQLMRDFLKEQAEARAQ